ncbi:TetR/AcrR family transcriptional regulator [Streptoalloteichus hindustanus]|uniref:Transcriptional regulator, TetR family n=1 Tax=Streptoalloteichus hindustanus TaxID=2017 RepID=A0A1M5DIT2_STRHI|nr:TetR/AcrR family transcriptional regulator [Streptoalloteichus hindustanus]SHF66836.1 transcriptional regulator, TetR family [Streptoalloteichus hindustanus]
MPRRVDTEQQRTDIAHAVWRLAARAGLEAVSLREVAAEAGVSMGRVQHYFRTKEEMLLHGLRLALGRMEDRISGRLRHRSSADAEDVLRSALEEMVGGDQDTRQAIRVCVAFYPRALEDPHVADLLFGDDDVLHALAADVVRAAQADHRAAPELDPDQEARVLWSVVNHLGTEVAFHRLPPDQARATLRYHLDRVLGPRPDTAPA